MQNKRQNLSKAEQSVKTNLSEALTLLRSKNVELTKDAYIYQDYAQKFADLNHISMNLGISYSEQQKSVSVQQSKSSIILSLETFLSTTIRESKDTKELSELNKFLDSNKRKIAQIKIMGCLP
jgi:hypothetical protein